MVLNRGWSHTIYRYHISSCMWSDTGSNEIMRQTLIHGALNLERLGRHGTFKSWALCLEH